MSTRTRDGMNRLHRVISRALDVLRVEGREGAPTWTERHRLDGYVLYAKSTLDLLDAHHLSEDEIVFPYVQRGGPLPAVAELADQHAAVEAAVAAVRGKLGQLATGTMSPKARQAWRAAVAALRDGWTEHVQAEEAVFERHLTGLPAEEDQAMAKRIDKHGRANAGSGAVMLPFILFNLTGADREDFEGRLPWILTGMLIPKMWKRKWGPMAPYLAV